MGIVYHLFTKHDELLDAKDAARAKAVNAFGLIVSFTCVAYFLIFIRQDNHVAATYIGLLAAICIFPILLNTLRLYRLARYVYAFQAPLIIFMYALIFGKDIGVPVFLFITFAFPFIFLDSSERNLIVIFFIYNSILVLLLEFVSFPMLPEIAYDASLKPILKLAVYLTAILFAGILFFIFFRAVRVTELDLLNAKFEAEKASNARKEFLATMSHEIRTPLNAVITISNMLEDKNEPNREELVQSLQLSSKTLLNIINDVLEFSKLEAGKISMHYRPTDLGRLMENLKKAYEIMATEKGLRFNLIYDSSISKPLEIDDVRLGQILGNLISNAIKFTTKGSIDVTVTKLENDDDSELIRFSVRDTGLGIRKEEIDLIFDSFSQSSTAESRKFGGTGLGLAIVKKLLEKQGSEIQVKSKLLEGTEFSFDLKVMKSSRSVEVVNEDRLEEELQGISVLVVEDNHINAVITEKLLARWGALTDLAVNGYQAVEKAAENSYDLILMDIHMPDIDGYEAAKRIRELDNNNSRIPMFAFSADVMVNQNKESGQYFSGLLSKPVDRRQLYEALVEVIKRNQYN